MPQQMWIVMIIRMQGQPHNLIIVFGIFSSINIHFIGIDLCSNSYSCSQCQPLLYIGLSYTKHTSRMGNEQPKKLTRATKPQIDTAALKAKIHLELIRDRKNADIIKGEKELVTKIKAKNRNRTEELLIAERVVNSLKYAQACNLLMGYAVNIRAQANFISQNMLNPAKMQPWLPMIYSLLFAADQLGLSSLVEFKTILRALNDPVAVKQYVNPQIISLLSPTPSPEELNVYFLEMSQRNQIELDEINIIGHKFTKEWKNIPSVTPAKDVNPYEQGGNNGNFNGNSNNQGFNPNNQGFNPNNQGFNPNNQGYNPNNQGNFNPYQNLDPRQFFNQPPQQPPQQPINNSNPYEIKPEILARGPQFYQPVPVEPKKAGDAQQPGRMSITSFTDIDYYPEIDAKSPLFKPTGVVDPSFDEICSKLRKGL